MNMIPLGVIVLGLCAPAFGVSLTHASEVRIEGNRVIVTTDSGEVIDTYNLPKGHEVKDGNNVVVTDNGVSIGSVTSSGGEQTNIRRNSTLENVVIINNGKTIVYRKGVEKDKGEQQK